MGKIVLASASPRRRQILKNLGLEIEVKPSPYEEKHTTTVFSYNFVENLAYNKAKAVADLFKNEDKIIVGADTVVVLDGEILGKPKDKNNAISMLKSLSGKAHDVVTSVAVINSKTGKTLIKSDTSTVEFEKLTDEQIEFYVNEFKPLDKAGAYGIQEMPKGYIKSCEGEIDTVIGLNGKTVLEMINNL